MPTDDQADPLGVQRNRTGPVDDFASTVISVLRGRQVVSLDGLRQFVLDHILRAVLSKGTFSSGDLLAELRGYRLTVDAVIDLYVPAAARMIGDQWVDDQVSFADVTISVLRLQALLVEASASVNPARNASQCQVDALVLVPRGEQHFLGASVVAGQLRRFGCEVGMSFDEDPGMLSARMLIEAPDLVLITCARRESLESVANTIRTIRKAVAKPPMIVVGGAVRMDNEDVIKLTDADRVTDSAEEALALYARSRQTPKPA